VKELDNLPFPNWDLLVNFKRLSLQPLMSSRGCPFSCNFCSVTAMFGRDYRAMSPERVLAEAERAQSRGIFFYDDNFTAHRPRAHAILDGLLNSPRRNIRWWSAQVRADVARDEELLAKMQRTGCARVYVGFESINRDTLKEMHKGQTPEDVSRAIRQFHRHRVPVHGMFIFGSDADDEAILRATNRFARKNRVDSVQYMILTPFPGTELFARMEREGRILHRMWRYYDGMHVVFRPKAFAPYGLQQLAIDSYSDFYNLVRALNEGLEAAAAGAARLVGIAARSFGAPSLTNAIIKLVGKRIIRRWLRGNDEYLRYLRELSPATAP